MTDGMDVDLPVLRSSFRGKVPDWIRRAVTPYGPGGHQTPRIGTTQGSNEMNRKVRRFSCLVATCLLAVLAVSAVAAAPQPAPGYPRMAPLSQYLMTDRAAEMALARSAAPAAISDGATVLVLEPRLCDGSRGQERLCLRRRARLDVPIRCPPVLESEIARAHLLQSTGSPIDTAHDI